MPEYRSIEITPDFIDSLLSSNFRDSDRRRFARALLLLDADERHPSLRVHQLEGQLAGLWSASASDALRMTFERLPNGRKRMRTCSHHYDR
jgi:hypothetical protein